MTNTHEGCQEGQDEVDIFSHFVDILTVGNLDVDIGTPRRSDICAAWWRCPNAGADPTIFKNTTTTPAL
jgi:hypothetical protein